MAHDLSPELPFRPADLLTTRNILAALAVYIIGRTVFAIIKGPSLPVPVPLIGNEGKGWLSGLTASIKVFNSGKKWAMDGYRRFNKAGKSFMLPGLPGSVTQVVLPRSQIKWMIEQPDNVLSTSEAHYTTLHGPYSFIRPDIIKYPYHEKVLHRYVPKRVNELIPGIEEEVAHAFDLIFGTDTQNFKSVNLWDALVGAVSRISNRMFIGLPASRNEEYLKTMIAFNDDVVLNMLLLNLVPNAILPVVGYLAGLPARYHWRKSQKYTMPIIKQRLHDFERKAAGDPEYKDWTPPNDYMTWHIEQALADDRPDEMTAEMMSIRLCPINFASIHTTVLTTHNFLFDLLASDPKDQVMSGLTEEITRVWAEEGGKATKDGMNKLIRVDSAIRESMRVNPLSQTGIGRIVVAPEGVVNKDEGWHAPQGTLLTTSLYSVMHDPEIVDNPNCFDAFRYSRELEAWEALPDEEKEQEEQKEQGVKLKQLGMTTTSDKHFPWGHGRHTCPGRFFVAHEIKIMFSYLVRNYEIKPLEERPKVAWIGVAGAPSAKARIEIRRKPGTVVE